MLIFGCKPLNKVLHHRSRRSVDSGANDEEIVMGCLADAGLEYRGLVHGVVSHYAKAGHATATARVVCPMSEKDSEEPFTTETLNHLYAELSAAGGVSVTDLRAHIAAFSSRPISKADLQGYREGKKPWKKLRDEVVPVEHFLSTRYPDTARVRFPLDDQPPDAWLALDADSAVIGIEVTGAHARAGIEVARSLVAGKPVSGFIPLPDNAPATAFAKARERGRIMNARTVVDLVIDEAIAARLSGKDDAKFEGHILLITAPIRSSPNRSEKEIQGTHSEAANALPFSEVYVLDQSRGWPIIRLK